MRYWMATVLVLIAYGVMFVGELIVRMAEKIDG